MTDELKECRAEFERWYFKRREEWKASGIELTEADANSMWDGWQGAIQCVNMRGLERAYDYGWEQNEAGRPHNWNKARAHLQSRAKPEGVDIEAGARAIWAANPNNGDMTWDEAKKQSENNKWVRKVVVIHLALAKACASAWHLTAKE